VTIMTEYEMKKTSSGMRYYTIPELNKLDVKIVYSTRIWFSNGINSQLDLTDDGSRSEFIQSLGMDEKKLVTVKQVHGANFIVIGRDGQIRGDPENSDGIISLDSDKIPGIYTADCVAIGLFSGARSVMALIHCGWKGLVSGIIQNIISTMRNNYDVDPGNLIACLGPAIAPCCFEVQSDVLSIFREKISFLDDVYSVNRSGNTCLDLREIAIRIMKNQGLDTGNIFSVDLCTSCIDEQFHSYRRDGKDCGRMLALMSWCS